MTEKRRAPEPKREIKPFGPHEDKATCSHEWEPHIWEMGIDYCPYCTSVRERQ